MKCPRCDHERCFWSGDNRCPMCGCEFRLARAHEIVAAVDDLFDKYAYDLITDHPHPTWVLEKVLDAAITVIKEPGR